MSIKLKDTIYDLINNADKLDGSHLTDIIRYYAPSSSSVLNLDDLKSTTGFQVTGWAYAGSPYVNSQPAGDGASSAATVIKFPGNYPFQIYRFYSSNDIKVRGYYSGTGWTSWATILTSDNYTTYCAPASHSHNYASTVKVGSTSYSCSSNVISLPAYPTIPTSLKCPKSLTIQLNGTSQGAWDGSADKTINITPASIGASASHSHPYLPIAGGGNLTGSAYISFNSASANSTELTNNTPFGITYGRIQGYGPMNIAADTDGSTSEYLVLTAGYSIANAVASNGLAIGYSTLKWKGVDISLSNHTHSYYDGYVMTHYVIDASGLNQNTYYPVTMPIGSSPNVRIEVIVSLNSGSVPSWSTHGSGFSVRKIWEVNGSGWGTNSINRRILISDYQHASADPVRGIGQLGYSSTEYVFVRGGGKYFFKVSHGIVPTLRTSEFVGTADPYYQSISPTTSAPAGIGRNIAYTSDIPSALKCPASLTIQLNGTSQGAWDGSSAKTINITPASIGASASHSHPYLPLAGGTLTGNVTVYTGQSGTGLKFGSSTLNSLSNQLLWQSAEAIRFGSPNWDWNQWAGLKYNYSSKIIYLGIPDNVIFNANSAQSGGSIYTPGVSNIYIGNGTYTVWHSGNFAPGNYMPKSGGAFTGSVTFANGTWNVVGDDAAIGDYNAAGMLGLKSCNNNIPGIGFHNSAGTLLGRLQSNGSTLQWNDQTIIHSGNIGSQSVNYANYAAYLPTLYIGGQQTNPQTYFNNGIGVRVAMTGMSSKGTSYWSDTLWINGYSGGDVPNMCALHFNRDGSPRAFISTQSNQSSSYGTFYEFITGYNIGSQSVNYANSAGSVAWGNVSGKPSSFTPSSHTHNYAGSSSAGGAATSANKLNTNAGSATKPVYFTNGVPTACTYGFGGGYNMPVVLAAGYIYKNSYTSTTWAFSGSYCPALTGGITTSVSGGVLAVTWTAASGRSRYIYGAVANMRTSGAVTSYSGTEYKDRSLGMYWLGTATSTSTTYIRAMSQGDQNNDTGMSYDEMWGTSSEQSDHCILSFSIIVIGYWT